MDRDEHVGATVDPPAATAPAGGTESDGDAPVTVSVDGRTLAYTEYGDPDGDPVVACHGVLGSRLTWALYDDAARVAGVRLLAPERPGFGHSAFQSGRRLCDWATDVAALADHCGVAEFGLVGFSAGGPHALAVAHGLPERVGGVALVSTVTAPKTRDGADPFNEAVLAATRFVPGFSLGAFGTGAWLARYNRPAFRASMVATAGAPDRALFDRPAGDHLVTDAAEALRQGGRGPARDLPLVGNDWGFDPRVGAPVTLFHGRRDATVAVETARAFADLLDCSLQVTDGAHYSTMVDERAAILEAAAR